MATPPSTTTENVISSQQPTIDTQIQNPISSNPTIPSPSPIPQQLPVINNLNPNPNVFNFQIQPLQQQVVGQQGGLYGGLMNFGGSAAVPAQQQQITGSVSVGVGGNGSNLSGAGATQFNLLTSPAQKVGLVQTSQFSSANSAGQSLQGMQQAIGTMGSSNLASQMMTTNGALYAQKQQLAHQASLNNQQAQQQQLAGGVGVRIGGGASSFGGSAAVTAQQQQLAGSVTVGIGGNTSSLSQSALAGQSGPFPMLSGAGATQSNQLTSPGQQGCLVQSSQFSSANSAGQSLQGTQAIGTMGSSNLASQPMATNGALFAQQLQLSQQAPLNNQQLFGLPQNGQPATIQNQLLKQIPAVSGSASLLPLQQPQRQQQLASSAQLQQSSLTMNQHQLPQLMQQQKPLGLPMGLPQLQQQLLHQQLLQQQHQLLQQQLQLQQQYQRLQQQLASSAQPQQNSLTLNQQQLPLLMQQPKSMGLPLLQQQQQQQLLQQQQQLQQQYQRLQQQLQQNSNSLTLNQQQLPQLMQQQKSMGQPLLQQQLQQQQLLLQQQQLVLQQQQQQQQQQRTQLLQQQLQALRMPGPTGQKSLSLTGLQPDAAAFGMTAPGGSSSQGTRTNTMSGQTEIMSVVRELKETRKEVKAIIKILLRFFKVMSIVMALFIFVTLFVVLIK